MNGSEKSTISADYVYYWNVDNWLREAADLLVEKIVNDKKWTAVIPIWALTFQAWNRAVWVDTKTNTEKKRWVIQLKFPWIKKYLIQ